MIAALYVDPKGVYANLPDVECWGLPGRDAREYAGPWPVVAHPPCQRWGRYWHGGPSARVRRVRGDDGGCFAAALASVIRWGGVLEHPAQSSAWRAFNIAPPETGAGWISAGMYRPGWTCCVEQGHYGHRARKATWLYAVGVELPELNWGASDATVRLDEGFHTAAERRQFKRGLRHQDDITPEERRASRDHFEAATGTKLFERLSQRERAATPPAFRDVLLAMARSATAPQGQPPQARL